MTFVTRVEKIWGEVPVAAAAPRAPLGPFGLSDCSVVGVEARLNDASRCVNYGSQSWGAVPMGCLSNTTVLVLARGIGTPGSCGHLIPHTYGSGTNTTGLVA